MTTRLDQRDGSHQTARDTVRFRLSPALQSFLEVDVIDRYSDDVDPAMREASALVAAGWDRGSALVLRREDIERVLPVVSEASDSDLDKAGPECRRCIRAGLNFMRRLFKARRAA